MNEKIAEAINILGFFFAEKRDITELSTKCLKDKYGIEQVDVMVLFGGSILCGGDILAQAMRNQIAKKYIIVGVLVIPQKRCDNWSTGNILRLSQKIFQKQRCFPAI